MKFIRSLFNGILLPLNIEKIFTFSTKLPGLSYEENAWLHEEFKEDIEECNKGLSSYLLDDEKRDKMLDNGYSVNQFIDRLHLLIFIFLITPMLFGLILNIFPNIDGFDYPKYINGGLGVVGFLLMIYISIQIYRLRKTELDKITETELHVGHLFVYSICRFVGLKAYLFSIFVFVLLSFLGGYVFLSILYIKILFLLFYLNNLVPKSILKLIKSNYEISVRKS